MLDPPPPALTTSHLGPNMFHRTTIRCGRRRLIRLLSNTLRGKQQQNNNFVYFHRYTFRVQTGKQKIPKPTLASTSRIYSALNFLGPQNQVRLYTGCSCPAREGT
jgi:hypothetical protein